MEIKIAHPTKLLFYFPITQNNSRNQSKLNTCCSELCCNIFTSKLKITKFSQWEDGVPCQKPKNFK